MAGADSERGRRGILLPLRDPRYRKVFAGQTVSSLGNGLVPVALAFAVLHETHSPTDLGIVLGSEQLAGLALFLLGGVAADRWSRRWVMVGADTARAGGEVTLGLLFVTGHPAIWVVAVLAALQGVGGGVFRPAAHGLVPAVVGSDQLQQANMLMSMASNITSVVAPSIGGVLVVTVGGGWAILADGVTFAVNVAFLLSLRVPLAPRRGGHSVIADLREGWSAFWSRAWYRDLVMSAAAFNFFTAVYLTLGPVVCERHYGGATSWAAIGSVGALGAVVGGLGTVRLRPRHPLRVGTAFMLGWPLLPLLLAAGLPLAVVCAAAAVGFLGVGTFNDLLYSAVGRVVPEEVLSRVISYDYFVAFLALPAGFGLAGPAAAAFGARTVLGVAGGCMMVVLVGTALLPSVGGFTVEGEMARLAALVPPAPAGQVLAGGPTDAG